MKKTSVIAVAILALAFVFSSAAFSQPAGMNGKMGQGKGMSAGMRMGMKKEMRGGFPMLMAKLKLTDQQKEKIAGLRLDFQKNMIDLKANLAKSKLALKELTMKSDFARNDVLAAVGNINNAKDAIATAMANHMLDVYALLTPEQQKIVRAERFLGGMRHPMMNKFRRECRMMK